MTSGEAQRKGHAGGYVIRLEKQFGIEVYLADYRRKDRFSTTPYPANAEWFRYEHDAKEAGQRTAFHTGWKLAVAQAPADARPAMVAEAVCDLEPGITPAEARMCFEAAMMTAAEEDGCECPYRCCSDDDLARVAAELDAEAKGVAGCWVP